MSAIILKKIDDSETYLIYVGLVCFGTVFNQSYGYLISIHIGYFKYEIRVKNLNQAIEAISLKINEMIEKMNINKLIPN